MTKLFDDALEPALIAGVKITEYWDLTLAEINSVIKAYLQQQKTQRIRDYNNNCMIASFTRLAFGGKGLPKIEDVYPDIVTEHNDDWIAIKEEFTDYADDWNRQRSLTNDP